MFEIASSHPLPGAAVAVRISDEGAAVAAFVAERDRLRHVPEADVCLSWAAPRSRDYYVVSRQCRNGLIPGCIRPVRAAAERVAQAARRSDDERAEF